MRELRARLCAVAMSMVAATASSSVAYAGGSDVECVDVTQTATDDALVMSFASRCDSAMRVSVEWTLVCKGGGGSRVESRIVSLDPGATREVTASAAACGDHGWDISGVKWSYKTGSGS